MLLSPASTVISGSLSNRGGYPALREHTRNGPTDPRADSGMAFWSASRAFSMLREQIRVLIIDDASTRTVIAAHFAGHGYVLSEAGSGTAGLRVFEEQQPDVVLTDLHLPDMSGLKFLTLLARRAPDTPTIVIAEAAALEDAVIALQKGAWEYVQKPLADMRVLEQAIARCVERAELLRDHNSYQKSLEREVRARTGELRKSYDELRAYQAMLQEKNAFLHTLVENMPNPIFYKNPDKGFLGCNELFTRLVPPERRGSILGKNFPDIFPREVARVLCLAEDLLSHGETGKRCEIDLPGEDGRMTRMAVYMGSFYDSLGKVAGIVGSFHDISDLKAKEAHILYQGTHDELTGLPNRLGLRRYMETHIRDSQGCRPFFLVYMDVDNFKTINDSLGHLLGDRILCKMADMLASRFVGGVVFRPGGDEFMLVSPLGADAPQGIAQAKAIQNALKEPLAVSGHEMFVQASCGVVLYPQDGRDVDVLLKNADLAMYRAKEEGGERICRYTTALTQRVTHRLKLEKMLRKGFENNEFILLYQPKIRLSDRRVVGMEALLRWSTSFGLIPPSEFIPVAEETGLIVELGKWILQEACTQRIRLADKGLADLRLSVNVSTHQLQESLPSFVQEVLDMTGLAPHLLELEITESAMMRDLACTRRVLCKLKERGVRIAIDDFGTGHSSLFYLKNFPVDTLKVDKSFVDGVCKDKTDATLVSSILSMARALCLETVAEGVEYEKQVDFLASSGCTEVQGYYYSRPIPIEDFPGFVQDRIWAQASPLPPKNPFRSAS